MEHLEKPWFHAEPSTSGNWKDDRVMADVAFWRKWKEAGYSVGCVKECRIGHLEEVVAVIDPDDKHRYVSLNEWITNGAP